VRNQQPHTQGWPEPIYAPYMAVYLVIYLPKIPYTSYIYIYGSGQLYSYLSRYYSIVLTQAGYIHPHLCTDTRACNCQQLHSCTKTCTHRHSPSPPPHIHMYARFHKDIHTHSSRPNTHLHTHTHTTYTCMYRLQRVGPRQSQPVRRKSLILRR